MSAAVLDSEFLSAAEVKDLAGCAKPDAQEAALAAQGVPCKRRGGRVLVSRFHVREWLAGRVVTPSRRVDLSLVK